MSLREGLSDSARKGELDGKKKQFRGSRAYQKFFEDYEEVTVPKKNGKGSRIRRIYAGEYYRKDCSDSRWIADKIIYLLLAVCSIIFFALAAYPNDPANRAWFVAVGQALTMAVYFRLLIALCSYLVSARNMTVSGWKRACRPLVRTTQLLTVLILLTDVISVIYYLIFRSDFSPAVVKGFFFYLVSAALAGTLCLLETRTNYLVTDEV